MSARGRNRPDLTALRSSRGADASELRAASRPSRESDQPNYGRPVRMPAMQMRIWFAPYVDSNDDLHFPSKVYTEVQPRRWAFGEQEFAGKGVIVPTKQLAEVPASPIQRNEPAPDAARQLQPYQPTGKGARCRTCREEIRTIQL
jgi:conjugal transfer pilus assembly protein TraV